jgi:hypothetical protein
MEPCLRNSVHFRATSKSAGRGEIRLGRNNWDTAIVPTLELQRLLGRAPLHGRRLIAKPDDKGQKNDF